MAETWDFLQSPAGSAAFNMALDETLLHSAAHRERSLLRVYSWEKPSVSFGYFQEFPANLASQYNIVRRPTGGGLVYHGDGVDTTYTVIAPSGHWLYKMTTHDAYCALHKAVAAAFKSQTTLHNASSLSPRGQYECFQKPVAGDVVTDGRKLAGGAQRRNKHGMLHQGSIAGRISATALKRAFCEVLETSVHEYQLADAERTLAEELSRKKYATDAWNRR